MKTKMATGIMGALAIVGAMGITGCGAESAESEPIGSVSAALSRTAALDALANNADAAMSCIMEDPLNAGHYFVLEAAGFSSAGTVTGAFSLRDPSLGGGSQTIAINGAGSSTALTTGRVYGKMIPVPGSASQCLAIGGENSGGTAIPNASTSVERITLSHTNTPTPHYVLTLTDESSGFTPRSKLQVSQCGTGSIIAVGGSASGSSSTAIQVWRPGAGWSTLGTSLFGARYDFGMAVSRSTGTFVNFIVGGGYDSGSGQRDDVETLKFSTTTNECDTVARNRTASQFGTARDKLVAFEDPDNNDQFVFAGGYDGSSVLATSEGVTVTWSGTPTLGSFSPGNLVGSTALVSPTLVITDPTNTKLPVLVGGATDSSVSTASNLIQKYTGGAFVGVGGGNNLSTARVLAVAEWVPNTTKIATYGGHDGATLLSSGEEITTP